MSETSAGACRCKHCDRDIPPVVLAALGTEVKFCPFCSKPLKSASASPDEPVCYCINQECKVKLFSRTAKRCHECNTEQKTVSLPVPCSDASQGTVASEAMSTAAAVDQGNADQPQLPTDTSTLDRTDVRTSGVPKEQSSRTEAEGEKPQTQHQSLHSQNTISPGSVKTCTASSVAGAAIHKVMSHAT